MTAGMTDAFTASYDVDNRMIQVVNSASTMRSEYDYDSGNKRVWERRTGNGSGEWIYFFGADGQRMGRYALTEGTSTISFAQNQASVWFAGKLAQKVDSSGTKSWPVGDRLASVGKYLPYGEDKPGATNPANDNEKFATYTRDGGTGLDYANQRWYVTGVGRFSTSDPSQVSGSGANPRSLNRYTYVLGDPANYNDRQGLMAENPEDYGCLPTPSDLTYDCWGGDPQGGLPLGAGHACLSGACIDMNGPMPLVRTGKWETEEQRLANATLLAVALAHAIKSTKSDHPTAVYVTHLALTMDCYLPYSVGNQGPTRYRRYEAYMGTIPLAGTFGVQIQEQVLQVNGQLSQLITAPASVNATPGVFEDTLGHPNNSTLTAQYYQYFSASTGPFFQNVPVPVLVSGPSPTFEPPGLYAVLSLYFSGDASRVSINGDNGFVGLPTCPSSVRP
jgi:RHS repeat-associated protein